MGGDNSHHHPGCFFARLSLSPLSLSLSLLSLSLSLSRRAARRSGSAKKRLAKRREKTLNPVIEKIGRI